MVALARYDCIGWLAHSSTNYGSILARFGYVKWKLAALNFNLRTVYCDLCG